MLRGAALVAALLALTPLASAQETPEDQEARQEFEAGREAFNAGRHESALAHFRRAYELSRRPQLLYNIGVAADRLRRDAEALEAFEQYLAQIPDAENRGDVDARITVLRRQIAAAETGEPARGDDPAPVPTDEGGGTPLFTWVALGAAVAAGILATVFWLDAGSEYDDLDARCGARGCTDAEIDESGIQISITMTNVFLVTAGVAAAGTVALFFLETGSSDDDPQVGIGPGSLMLRGRF